MIAVYKPKDLDSGYKKIIENAIRDLSPDTKENVINLLKNWRSASSKEELNKIVGSEKANYLIKKIQESNGADLTEDEKKTLNNIFKDSLTFD
jgi:hypothetical protein